MQIRTLMRYSKNETEAESVSINVTTFPVTYVYDSGVLCLVYSLAFSFAMACSISGLYAFWTNAASYQNAFSSFIRVANDPNTRVYIEPGDSGADPLPKYLAKAKLVTRGRT